jgi:glutamate-5-semialdehyde dehydrogenase
MSLTNAQPAEIAQSAQSASRVLATLSAAARNDALTALYEALARNKAEILAANARDLSAARNAAEKGELSSSIVSRLDLGKPGKFDDMLRGIKDVRDLDDPGNYLSGLYRHGAK